MTDRVRKRATQVCFDDSTTPNTKAKASAVRNAILEKDSSMMTAIDEDLEFPDSQEAYAFASKMMQQQKKN